MRFDQRKTRLRVKSATQVDGSLVDDHLKRGTDVPAQEVAGGGRSVPAAEHDVGVQLGFAVNHGDVTDEGDDLRLLIYGNPHVLLRLPFEKPWHGSFESPDGGQAGGRDAFIPRPLLDDRDGLSPAGAPARWIGELNHPALGAAWNRNDE